MKVEVIKKKLFYIAAVGFSILLLFLFIGGTWIGYEVKSVCQDAEREYGGDCVDSLVLLLGDEGKSYRSRNNAIWALGQIGDSRALPVLQSYYTDNIPEREPLDNTISQYELNKAINLAGGGTNISAFVWRSFVSSM